MKKRIFLLAAALTLGLSLTAGAAEEPVVHVQLDGQELEFTDAVPQVRDQRTFLPFRAVFEAMGAQVDNEGDVITAARGDTTLTMTIGSTEAVVEEGGKTRALTMDVAPYVDNTTWRTYVPVRFAADAFGCNVGWDQEAMTAVIVDVDALVDRALGDKELTILDKYLAYSQKYNQGNWAMEAAFTGSAQAMGADALTLEGTVTGVAGGSEKADVSGQFQMDMTGLLEVVAAMQGMTLEELGVTPADCVMAMGMDMKMDLGEGVYYFKYDDATTTQMGVPAGAWLSMDLGGMMAELGMDLEDLKNLDFGAMLKAAAKAVPLDGKADGGYQELAGLMETLAATVSDEGFTRTENGYELTLTFPVEGAEMTCAVVLDTDGQDAVVGYSMDVGFQMPLDEESKAALAQMGLTVDAVTMDIQMVMDETDHGTATLSMAADQMFVLDMDMTYDYAIADREPQVTLPEGTQVVDLMEMLAAMGAGQE